MRRLCSFAVATLVVTSGLTALVIQATPAGAVVPAGFTDELVASVGAPTALAFTPDGRLLITTQGGTLRVVQNGALLATPAVNLSSKICANSERGLLGVAVDPAFTTNGYVFLYYSFNKASDCGTGTVNRVSRFVMTANTLGSEIVLIDNIASPAGNHNAGDLNFGKDGLLYVSVGDGGCDYPGTLTPSGCAGANDASRDRNVLMGKILRIDRDGNVPPGNPFTGAGTARCNAGPAAAGQVCQETFAWGLRNPFRFAFDPNPAATTFHINDVGQGAWEEIDLGLAGADYGWNVREGHCANGSTTNCGPPPAGMTNPIFDYGRADGCRSITGGAFVPNGAWPAEYDGKYLFADFVCGKIFRLEPNGSGGFTRVDFATGLGGSSAVHLRFGPSPGGQALYYTTYANGGEVRRIVPPAVTPPADPPADFDGNGSTDISVYRPGSAGAWFINGQAGSSWGTTGDIPVPGDYDGNGTADIAVYRPGATGTWFIKGQAGAAWGGSGDIPVPADYDGNGTTDIAVYRPSNGGWYIKGQTGAVWGNSGDIPVPGDYDANGTTDIAVYRPSNGGWYIKGQTGAVWGNSGDIPVPGDYDANGTTEIAVFRPSNGGWYIKGQTGAVWGNSGDIPVPGDYDANGTTDIAVYRPASGGWFIKGQTGSFYGATGDIPLPLPYAIRNPFFP
jgi:glucose/arabinose dehydrogenase